jgi:hypothetical protein
MDPKTWDAFAHLVKESLLSPDAEVEILRVHSMLNVALERNRFNTERAQELFRMAIERSVWKKFGSTGAMITREMKRGRLGIIEEAARVQTEELKNNTGALDQRSPRRGLLAKVLGK